jgi:hypothetical protein
MLPSNGYNSFTVESFRVESQKNECNIETRAFIKTYPYTDFTTLDPTTNVETITKGQWEEIGVANRFGITLDLDSSDRPSLEWEVDQDFYIHEIVPTFAPVNDNVSIPQSVRVEIKFHSMDPTNPSSGYEDVVSVVFKSNGESADASCDFTGIAWTGVPSTEPIIFYTIESSTTATASRTPVTDSQQDIRFSEYLEGRLDLDTVTDSRCKESLRVTLDW